MDKSLEIVTHITWEEYRNFAIYSLYKRPVILGVSILGAICALLLAFGFFYPIKELSYFSSPLFFVIFAFLLPIIIFFNAKRAFTSSSRITEYITYRFEKQWIFLKGQSFETKMSWDKIVKVKETKSWFLIYQTKYLANLIPKTEMTNQQIIEMRDILRSIPNLNLNLVGFKAKSNLVKVDELR